MSEQVTHPVQAITSLLTLQDECQLPGGMVHGEIWSRLVYILLFELSRLIEASRCWPIIGNVNLREATSVLKNTEMVDYHNSSRQPAWPRSGIVLLLISGVLLMWYVSQVLLLIFAGILLAILLRIPTNWLHQRTGLPEPAALALIVLLVLGGLAGGTVLLAPTVINQINGLIETLPESMEQFRTWLQQYSWLPDIPNTMPPLTNVLPGPGSVLSNLGGIFAGVSGLAINLLVFFAAGLFFALQPRLYVSGVVKLFPQQHRDHVHEVLHMAGYTLKWWLISRLFSMVLIGVSTGIGLWLLGVPYALLLGLVSGLLNFIPFVGTFLALIPVGMVALLQSPITLLYVLLFYTVVQTIESYLLTPMVQQRAIHIPPALALTAQMLLSVLVGTLGFLLAVPLTAVGLVLVKLLYVRDVLGDDELDMREPG
jgi:predicted PurR-regulated permease PerM